MTMKGDKSLEMIIGLIVLLVVAAVVINMFLGTFDPNKIGKVNPQCDTDRKTFITKCERLCNQFQTDRNTLTAKEFCETHTKLDVDCDNKMASTTAKVGLPLDICEDAVYCFMVQDCSWASGQLGWSECVDTLCEVYTELYDGDVDSANAAVLDKVDKGESISCKLPEQENLNWFDRFYGQNPCGF
ncbi:MAG: hypothetical protein ABIH90_01205 [Candidatus Aenigmatarchaeota archaeon]